LSSSMGNFAAALAGGGGGSGGQGLRIVSG